MKYYKTGEFAKMANVSLRTIRYYDTVGLLKPSVVQDNGYRLYSDSDLVKLQQILSLKYLGFSLDEIFSMTVNNDSSSLKESLELQSKLVKQKIDHLRLVEESIEKTRELLDTNESMDWSNLLNLIHLSTMEHDIVDQYKNSKNIDIRINLHDKYSSNPKGWFKWLFEQYDIKPGMRILEIGSGNGKLWKINEDRIDKSLKITVSDISSGMVNDARDNLRGIDNIEFKCFDCLSIPFDDDSFDIVIANHVMFYVSDIDKALKEIKRVLKKEGVFYCSAYGKNHMKEITDLVKEYDSRIVLSKINLFDVFGLENGKEILSRVFDDTEIRRYENDSLIVDNPDDIEAYILSC
ncbi:MAG: methyltransferase domain-containing protein, partial [Erysipelotrichaceae bacterium]|nr:methyltransferase domain-containing protein [Erysipelotrichaceae bacterium]